MAKNGKPKQNAAASGRPYATYPERQGNLVNLYALGSEGPDGTSGAFADIAAAIRAAKTFIFICDWSFQPYVRLGPRTSGPTLAQTVGALLNERAKAGVLVAIHVWAHVSAGAPDDQNNDGAGRLDEIARTLNPAEKARSANLLWRMSSRTGVGYSFHQKFIVLDADDPGVAGGRRVLKVFFGGLDLTKGRFDWGEHPILYPGANVEPLAPRITQGGRFYDDWYNAEFTTKNPKEDQPGDPSLPRQPWQDYYAQLIGPAAWDVAREFVGRWNSDNGSFMSGPNGNVTAQDRERVERVFQSLFEKGKFFQEWEEHGGPFVARVVRSIEKVDWTQRKVAHTFKKDELFPCETPTSDGKTQVEFTWKVAGSFERSIEIAYVNAIRNANRFIYIESQYFIGSGADWGHASVKNRVPRTIVDKICEKIDEGVDFHAYIVIPQFPEGVPSGGAAPAQRLFEWNTMRAMAQAVYKRANAKGKDWSDYLSFYFLMNWTDMAQSSMALAGSRVDRVRTNQRYMVYVHSKLMIIDDQFYICGSANLNERSLAGDRDTEICLYLRPGEGKLADCQSAIADLRKRAWRQHLGGVLPPDVDHPEKPACSSDLQIRGQANWALLSAGVHKDKSHWISLPFFANDTAFYITPQSLDPVHKFQDLYIFDAPARALKPPGNGTLPDDDWRWDVPNGTGTFVPDYLAE